jgi:hypothetical protein
VTGTLAVELAEALDVIKSYRELAQSFILRVNGFDACKVKQSV